MPTYEFIKTPDGIMPGDKQTSEFISKIPIGEVIEFTHEKKRNVRRHKKFFAVLQRCIDRGGVTKYLYIFRNVEQLRFTLMQLLGIGEWMTFNNQRMFKPDSIAFDNMDEDTFVEKVFNPSVELLCDMFDCDEVELMDEY